jgi:hypothetical protein
MNTNDTHTDEHNRSQLEALKRLFDREAWYLSKPVDQGGLGYDVHTTAEGHKALELRIAYLLKESEGARIAALPSTIN